MRRLPKRKHERIERVPTLRFTPNAWAKLLYWRDRGGTEVGGFGISAEDAPLLVEDVCLVGQRCTAVSVQFKDTAVADFFDEQVDRGVAPERFARLWLHTHPGNSPLPSATDEDSFERVFGRCDWAVMFILAQNDETYTRMSHNRGPRVAVKINTEVDFSRPFVGSNHSAWDHEYLQYVTVLDGFAANLLSFQDFEFDSAIEEPFDGIESF